MNNVKDWLKLCHSTRDFSNGLSWSLLFPLVCFEIWKDRNRAFFDKQPHDLPSVTISKALNLAKEFRAAQTSSVLDKTARPSKWSPSPPLFVHIHVDASFVNIETKSSLAVFVRDCLGGWLYGCYSLSYAIDPYHAELLALRKGFELAREKHYTHAALMSDCKKAVDTINGNVDHIDFYSDLIMECRELRHYFQETSLTFTRREDNQVADRMASECRQDLQNFDVIRHFPFPPNYCQALLSSDCKRLFAITL